MPTEIDVSLRMLTFGLDRHHTNAAFHPVLARLTCERMKKNPAHPLPMMR